LAILTRKISRSKWEHKDGFGPDEICSDAVTSDLRTTDNALSFWRCEVDEAALALAATLERPDKLDIAWMTEDAVREEGLLIAPTDGRTPVESLVKSHVDVERLDLVRLSKVAHLVAKAVRDLQCKRLTKNEVVSILADAVQRNILELNMLADLLRDAVQAAIARRSFH
jgi:hypothetical protein